MPAILSSGSWFTQTVGNSANAIFVTTASAIAALALPTVLAFNLPPSSTFLNQALALAGCGVWLIVLFGAANQLIPTTGLVAVETAIATVLIAALASLLWAALPASLLLSSAGLILASALIISAGAASQSALSVASLFRAFCLGLVVGSVLSSLIGLIQVFAPTWPDGDFIARSYIEGRAVGNMRQPNHLSSLLLWGIVAVVWLGEARVLRRWGSTLLALLFIFVVVLSASRTGAVSMLLIAAWGVVDKRLSPPARRLLIAAPLVYLVFWYGTGVWADQTHHVFGGETRFNGKGDVSSSRFGIWSNTLSLIRMHPWFGVGFGEFNFAWTLTPFPGRPVAFFDHTHNLPLQLLVELGIPLGSLVIGLLAWALWQAFVAARRSEPGAEPGEALLRPAAFMMVLLILVHSLLEYPLWYAYFLLPTAFAWGLCLGGPAAGRKGDAVPSSGFGSAPAPASGPALASGGHPGPAPAFVTASASTFASAAAAGPASASASASAIGLPSSATGATESARGRRSWPLMAASLLLLVGGVGSVFDYARVVVIFAPPEGSQVPLAQRIADGRKSIFFAHHADYAAATTTDHPGSVLYAFKRAPHYLLDARLMQAWAKALDESGDTDRARYLAARLREFRNEQSADFFAPCEAPPEPGRSLPFQCLPPVHAYTYEDFR